MSPYSLTDDDLELWLAGYLRGWLASNSHPDVFASNTDPPRPRPWQVRIRYDGGDPASQVTERSRIGVTVTGPDTDTTGKLTADLARLVRRGIINIPPTDPANPVVRVDDVPRFVRVLGGDTERPTRYASVTLTTLAEQPL